MTLIEDIHIQKKPYANRLNFLILFFIFFTISQISMQLEFLSYSLFLKSQCTSNFKLVSDTYITAHLTTIHFLTPLLFRTIIFTSSFLSIPTVLPSSHCQDPTWLCKFCIKLLFSYSLSQISKFHATKKYSQFCIVDAGLWGWLQINYGSLGKRF